MEGRLADFAIADGVLLVMWLVTVATPEQLKMVSRYFGSDQFRGGSASDRLAARRPGPQRTSTN